MVVVIVVVVVAVAVVVAVVVAALESLSQWVSKHQAICIALRSSEASEQWSGVCCS